MLLEDGDILQPRAGPAEVIDSAPVGRLALDGNRLVPLNGGVLSARRRMLFNGVVLASLAVDEAGRIRGEPRVSAPGLFEATIRRLAGSPASSPKPSPICRRRCAGTTRR